MIVGYGAVLLMPEAKIKSVLRLIVIVSSIVAGLGVIQYFLPANYLTHFGYSVAPCFDPTFS